MVLRFKLSGKYTDLLRSQSFRSISTSLAIEKPSANHPSFPNRSYTSDKTQDRRYHNAALLLFAGAAALVSLITTNNTVKYVMMCFLIGGMYTTVPLILNWTSESLSRPERKRSIAIALVNSFGHTSYIWGSYLWPSGEGPRNLKGFAASTAVLGLGAVLAALGPVLFRRMPGGWEEDDVVRGREVVVELDEKPEKLEK